jgi:hypothetical protein
MTAFRPTLAVFVLALACATPAIALAMANNPLPESQATIEQADAQLDRIATNTGKYLFELDRAIDLAKKGTYGKLPKGSFARLDEARGLIGDLLKGDIDPRTLPHDQRLALYNAHSTIESIINRDDKSRVVCKREQHLGSRVATTECLTIGEREDLAWHSSQSTADLMRTTCVQGETSRCSLDH